jgi:hypothetical protein
MVTEADGTQMCMEADNEKCDDDPCDTDDDVVKTSKKPTSAPKPATTKKKTSIVGSRPFAGSRER